MDLLFKNKQIDTSTLPKAESVDWVPLNQKYLPISLIGTWVFGLILIGIFTTVNILESNLIEEQWIFWLVLCVLILFFATISIVSILGFKHKAYAVRAHDIMYKSGLIFRKIIIIPFNRIQHSEINQGPIERQFKLSKLNIFTAGGQNSDLSIPGLLQEEAQDIKAFIMEKSSKHE